MKSIYDAVVPPSQYLVLVDEIALFVLAAKEETDNRNIVFCSLLDLLEEVNFLLDECSKWGETCACSDEDHFFPFHRISKGGFPQFSSKLFGVSQEMLRD